MMNLGLSLIKWSVFGTIIAALPLLFIMIAGPEDANPIGPGLLFFGVSSLAMLFMPCGAIISAVAWWRGERF